MSRTRFTYKTTVTACFSAYVVQAAVVNFLPLLFVQMQREYGIPLSEITVLVTVNFGLQLLVDLASVKFVDKIGYRAAIVAAHLFSAAGFFLLTALPKLMDPFAGLLIAVGVYAVGGGLMEVLISPIVENCPTPNKEKAMSLLHSFYSWGQVGVVLLSTLYFRIFGVEHWRALSYIWALLPLANALVFAKTPIAAPPPAGQGSGGLTALLRHPVFWLLCLMMLCSGAAEQAVSQWASVFAEQGLGISKTAGDLAGPMAFAVLMGTSRAFYGHFGHRIRLSRFMLVSAVGLSGAYLLIALSPSPAGSLIGCAVCGLTVGIMWPGSVSTAAERIPTGGTAMFAMLALFGDLGCAAGPAVVGTVTDAAGNMQTGMLAAVCFPAAMLLCLLIQKRRKKVTQ